MRKRQVLIALTCMTLLFILAAAHRSSQAGLFKDSVEFSDLAQLSQKGLEALKEIEWQVFLMRVGLARAEELKKQAEGDLKNAEHLFKSKELDFTAAKAERRAAKESENQERMDRAATVLESAQNELRVAKRLVAWKSKVVKARKAGVKKARRRVQLAEAQRDLASVSQLVFESAPSAKKFSMQKYQNRVKRKQEEYENATIEEERQTWEAKESKEMYESIVKRKHREE
jgi:hypothetical protein